MAAACGGQTGEESNGGDTAPDVTPPRVIATFPADQQELIPVNTVIAITFSEAMNVRRLDLLRANFGVFQAINGVFKPVQTNPLRWEARSNTLFITPTTLLTPNAHFSVTVGDGMTDVAGNRLDLGSPGATLTWRFTTGAVFDRDPPVWNAGRTVQAVAERYDTITVCWWSGSAQSVTGCPLSVDALPPAASDAPNNDSNGLIYTVLYKRTVDAAFTEKPSGLAAHRVTLTNLVASTEYEIQLRVSDLAANQAAETLTLAQGIVRTPPAGRLYAVNQVANSLSVFSDISQAQGDKNASVVTTGQTQLFAPTGIAVDPVGGYVYVADTTTNTIAAYKMNHQKEVGGQSVDFKLGQYGIGHSLEPDWTIQGTLTSTDITKLCGPSSIRLERHTDIGRTYLYVANSQVLLTGYSPGRCVPDNILVFDITQTPQGPNTAPYAVIRNADYFRTPLAFALDETNNLIYVANRDNTNARDNAGGVVSVFSFSRNAVDRVLELSPAPLRIFWGSVGGPCTVLDAGVNDRICGPTAAAYDADSDSLIVVNRGKSNVLVFSNASSAVGAQSATMRVVSGAATGLDGSIPVGVFLDTEPFDTDSTDGVPQPARVYVTTDGGQSVLIFDRAELLAGGNVTPRRIIKGTKTMLGQPAVSPAFPSRGPFAIAVTRNDTGTGDEAYVVTPGSFDVLGLTPIPSMAIFDVSVTIDPPGGATNRVTNTPPDRVLINPLLGPAGVAVDVQTQRLYVASFHSNMILVYDSADQLVSGVKAPDRIVAGPATRLDHPVALLFRRLSPDDLGALYVVNQSSHSIVVFPEGDGENTPLLEGNVAPERYLGPPEGANPFSAQENLTEMAWPTGIAVDPEHDILYVSNRDAKVFQDLVGRRIVMFKGANTVQGNVAPTWKIQGADPGTDRTSLKRPAGLYLIPDGDDAASDDRLIVANRGNGTVLVFRGLSALVRAAEDNPSAPPDSNLSPTWTITNPSLSNPFGLAFNGTTSELFVSDIANRILAFNLGLLSSDTPVISLAARVVQGATTGLLTPHGLALDPQN